MSCARGPANAGAAPAADAGAAPAADAATAASAPTAPDPSPALAAESAWTARSADGRVAVVHAAAAGGACAVAATDAVTGVELWRSDACLGWRTDPVFVSSSGERVLVLKAAAHADSRGWSSVEVASLFERGKLVRTFRGDELVKRERIVAMRAGETWARGLRPGVKEQRPAYGPGDCVRIEAIDEHVVRVGFDGTVSSTDPAAVAVAAGPAADDDGGLYKWTDDAGEVHYTNGVDIPAKYRVRAKPVRAQVGVVPVERVSGDFAPSRTSWSSSESRRPSPPAPAPPKYEPPREMNHFERSAEAAWGARVGYGGVKINQKPQVCTTKGDITECRDAK